MSNDHHYLPILLITNHLQNQSQASIKFLQNQKNQQLSENDPQITWINKDNKTISINDVRQLTIDLAFASRLGKKRYYILLNSEKTSSPAQNALLKSLEEPPVNTQIILVTSQLNSVLATIRSRCLINYYHEDSNSTELIELANEKNDSLQKIFNFCIGPKKLSYGQLIELCEEYKDRKDALDLVNLLLIKLHQQKNIDSNLVDVLKQLLNTLQYLGQNANVKLALETGLFAIKNV